MSVPKHETKAYVERTVCWKWNIESERKKKKRKSIHLRRIEHILLSYHIVSAARVFVYRIPSNYILEKTYVLLLFPGCCCCCCYCRRRCFVCFYILFFFYFFLRFRFLLNGQYSVHTHYITFVYNLYITLYTETIPYIYWPRYQCKECWTKKK